MKILVAGGAGYLGSILVPKLIERGHQVTVVDLLWFGNHLPAGVRLLNKNILDLHEDDLHGCEQVIFMAGLSSDPMAEYSPAKNFVMNAAAPAFLGFLAKKCGVRRYIYASSCSVYGFTEDQVFDESCPAVSNYPYGMSKLQGEDAALQLADESFSVIALRTGTICGYSPRMRLDLIINTMFKCALKDGVIRVNNPRIWRPVLSAHDAAAAYLAAIEAAEITGVFNIASGNFTVGEIGHMVQDGIRQRMGEDPQLVIDDVKDFRNYKVSTDKARQVLGFQPKDDVPAILRDLVANVDRFKDWDNPAYYNIQVFKRLEESEARALVAAAGRS